MLGRALIVALGVLFGACDQYLGSLWVSNHVGFWTIDISGMSALWLALPFCVGGRERDAVRAAALGAVVTFAALAGYFAMTLSPIEGVFHVDFLSFVRSQEHVILPAIVTGPLWGWLGYRWKVSRSGWSAGLVVGAFCLEPLARILYGNPFAYTAVAVVEVAVGVALAAVAVVARRRWRRQLV